MALHIIVESTPGEDGRWRAEVDPHDGWTRLFDGARRIASAWYCAPERWERIEPDVPAIRGALGRVGATLERLGFTPLKPHAACDTAGPDCEAV